MSVIPRDRPHFNNNNNNKGIGKKIMKIDQIQQNRLK